MTACECVEAGWCRRHQCQKTPHWHFLCQTRPDYFVLWEEGRGPGQISPAPKTARRGACGHLGSALREQACPACRGNVRIKVLACELHQQCTIGRRVESIACCAACSDYQPSATDQ